MLTKQFNRIVKHIGNRPQGQSSSNYRDERNKHRFQKFSRKAKDSKNPEHLSHHKRKGIQCRECEGFGHIQIECHTFIERHNKNLSAIMSNE